MGFQDKSAVWGGVQCAQAEGVNLSGASLLLMRAGILLCSGMTQGCRGIIRLHLGKTACLERLQCWVYSSLNGMS